MSTSSVEELAAHLARLETELQSLRQNLSLISQPDNRVVQLDVANTLEMQWKLVTSMVVFLMQIGFGMFEVGLCRVKNTNSILMKNILDTCIVCVVWWLVGQAFAVCPLCPSVSCQPAHQRDSTCTTVRVRQHVSDSTCTSTYSACPTPSTPMHHSPVVLPSQYGEGGSFIGEPASVFFQEAVIPDSASNVLWFQTYVFATASVTIVSGSIAERTTPIGYACHAIFTACLIYPVTVRWCTTPYTQTPPLARPPV